MKQTKQCLLSGIFFLFAILAFTACDEDELGTGTTEDPVASFVATVNPDNYLEVTFTNNSINATSYSWDFGDEGTSTDSDPVYTYSAPANVDVVLTASNDDGASHSFTVSLSIEDPNDAGAKLYGSSGKSWQLLANTEGGNAFEVGPTDRSQVWWSFGGVEELCVRECIMDDTWTFNPDGSVVYDNNGDFFGEAGVWPEDMVGTCFDATVADNWISADDSDLSAWNSATNQFDYDATAGTLNLTGGFIGLAKAATSSEVTIPQASVSYTVVSLVDADVDTLILETTIEGGYWRSILVSYDNASDVVVTEECEAVTAVNVTFQLNFNDYAGSAVTPEVNGTFNNWCGNCNAMSDDDGDGIWTVTLELAVGDHEFKFSADSWADQEALTEGMECTITSEGNTNRTLTVGESDMTVAQVCWNSCDDCDSGFTTADLVGGWKLSPVAGSLGVGPSSGDTSWWSISEDDVTTRSCVYDDVYTFGDDNSFTITQDGSTWVETWQGIEAEGCAVPVAPHDGSGTYTYEATETSIKVIGSGAFIALAKAVNAGELSADGVETPADVTYSIVSYASSDTGVKSMTIEIEAGSGVFWTFKLVSE